MKPTGSAVAKNAVSKIGKISYSEQDCQSFVENCVKDCGGQMSYAGSNDMFRNACIEPPLPLNEARAKGWGVPAALCFQLKHDGGEPAKYKADGIGNAEHVGFFFEGDKTIHSGKSRGGVVIDKLNYYVTHIGLAKCIEYSLSASPSVPSESPYAAYTTDIIRMRKGPKEASDYIMKIPKGTQLTITEEQGGYGKTTYKGVPGWAALAWVVREAETEPSPKPTEPTPMYILTVYAANGKPVKMRALPSTECNMYWELPVGTEVSTSVSLNDSANEWVKIYHDGREGYMKREFLTWG